MAFIDIITKNNTLGFYMQADTHSIKANNHRIYQSPSEKKPALLNLLIEQNMALNIVVVTSKDAATIRANLNNKSIRVIEDRELVNDKTLSCDLLISYDIPIKAIIYMARIAKATQKAFLLLDEEEQKELHGIEMLLGRAIKQESLEGFEYPAIVKTKPLTNAPKQLSKEQIKDEAKKRYDAKTQERPKREFKEKADFKEKGEKKEFKSKKEFGEKKDFKEKKEFKGKKDFGAKKEDNSKDAKSKDPRWEKKKKALNKFLGKDENGKAIFSGKDGARNHRFDGTPKEKVPTPQNAGRKINIKALKPKEPKAD